MLRFQKIYYFKAFQKSSIPDVLFSIKYGKARTTFVDFSRCDVAELRLNSGYHDRASRDFTLRFCANLRSQLAGKLFAQRHHHYPVPLTNPFTFPRFVTLLSYIGHPSVSWVSGQRELLHEVETQ